MTLAIKTLNFRQFMQLGTLWALLSASQALAQSYCNAYFPFDGNLEDVGGNGYNGTMIGIGGGGGAGKASFGEGRFGQALKLDGTSAMRALMDLHYESCPKVTITAWVNHIGSAPMGAQSVVSTGSGSGPGMRLGKSTLILNGTGNGISRPNAIRTNGGWTFVAGVYDYEKREYTLYVRSRSIKGELGGKLYEPEDSLWVGAFNDTGSYPLKDVLIDDLRIYGRALSPEDIHKISTGTQAVGASSCAFPDVCFEPANPTISARTMPGSDPNFARSGAVRPDSDPNFARAGATLPGSDPNFARAGAVSPDDGGQIPLSGTRSTSGSGLEADIPQSVGGIESRPLDDATIDALSEARSDSTPLDLESSTSREVLNDATMDALAEARADSAIPDLTAEPGEVDSAADEQAGQEASTPQAVTVALRYTGDILVHSGVTGGNGDYTQRVDFTQLQHFPYWLETRENYDKPCTVYIHSAAGIGTLGTPSNSRVTEYDVCDEGLPRINPLTTLARALDDPEAGAFKPITAIQVCNNSINKRVKGIRAQVRRTNYPDGNWMTSYDTVVFEERSNCVKWEPLVSCPTNTFAVGLTLHFRDGDVVSPRDFLSGLELNCSEVSWMKRTNTFGGEWEPL